MNEVYGGTDIVSRPADCKVFLPRLLNTSALRFTVLTLPYSLSYTHSHTTHTLLHYSLYSRNRTPVTQHKTNTSLIRFLSCPIPLDFPLFKTLARPRARSITESKTVRVVRLCPLLSSLRLIWLGLFLVKSSPANVWQLLVTRSVGLYTSARSYGFWSRLRQAQLATRCRSQQSRNRVREAVG